MQLITYNDIIIELYTDPIEFFNIKEKPLGEIPENWVFAGIVDGKSSGFCILEDKTIFILIEKNCPFEDLLATVSHELGHLVEGGFKKNPPNTQRYFKRHEEKAEHYENFVIDSFNITNKIFNFV